MTSSPLRAAGIDSSQGRRRTPSGWILRHQLACIGGGISSVDYATNLAARPQKRSGTSEEENRLQRLYFMWRTEGPLKQFDAQLLAQAGVRTQGRQLLKFIPKELEEQLAQTEMNMPSQRAFLSQHDC